MTIHVAVVADVRRGAGVELADRVNADYVSVDRGDLGCLGNHRAAWQWHLEHPADWAVTLEDDAEPVDGFRDQLGAALAVAPVTAPIISLYLGGGYLDDPRIRTRVVQAQHNGICWLLTHGTVLHAVALAIRGDLVSSALSQLTRSKQPPDRSLSRWARGSAHDVAYSCPSIVEHRDMPSLVQRFERAPRRAWVVGERMVWSDKSVFMT